MKSGRKRAIAATLNVFNYRLSEEAKEDLILIADYGDQNYGTEKSDAFRDKLKAHFAELAKHPLHHQAVSHIRKNYRRSVHGPHTVYYRIDETEIVIVRILGRQDPFRALN